MRVRVLAGALAALVICSLAAALPAGAAGPICTVPGDYATIGAALTDAGCLTITVAAGPYTGPFQVARDVTLLGNNAAISPVTGVRGAASTITSANDGFVLTADGINVTIRGFDFTSTPGEGVTATASGSRPTVEKNVFADPPY